MPVEERTFTEQLQAYILASGIPYKHLAQKLRVDLSTIYHVMDYPPRKLPAWERVLSIVYACGMQYEKIRVVEAQWLEARSQAETEQHAVVEPMQISPSTDPVTPSQVRTMMRLINQHPIPARPSTKQPIY